MRLEIDRRNNLLEFSSQFTHLNTAYLKSDQWWSPPVMVGGHYVYAMQG